MTTPSSPPPPPLQQQQQQPRDLLSMIGSFDSQSDTADIHHQHYHHHYHRPSTGSEMVTPPPHSHHQHHRFTATSTTRPKPRRCYIFYDSDTDDTESDNGHNQYQQQQQKAEDEGEEAFDDYDDDDDDDGEIFHYKRRLFVDAIDASIPPIVSPTSITSTSTAKTTIGHGHEDMPTPTLPFPKGTTNVVTTTTTTTVRPRLFSFRRAHRKHTTRGGTLIPCSSLDDADADTPPTPHSTPPISNPNQYRISNIAAQAIANIHHCHTKDNDATVSTKYWSHEYPVRGSTTTVPPTTLLLPPDGPSASKDDGASIREFDMAGNDDTTDSVSSSSSSTTSSSSSSSSPSNQTHHHDERLCPASIIAAPTCGRNTTITTDRVPHKDMVVSRSMPHSIDRPLHCRIQSVTSLLVHDFNLLSKTVSTSSTPTAFTPSTCAMPTTSVTWNTSQCTSGIGTDHNDRCWYDRKLWIRNPIVSYLILPQWYWW
jgi:hypothetical protein